MSERVDPLHLEAGDVGPALRVVRQSPPAGSATFAATMLFDAGWGRDPPGQEGTAYVTSQLAVSGAGRLDRRALARQLDRLGATLTARCDPETAELMVWGPTDGWRTLLGLLADAALRPRHAPSELERIRRQLAERQLREVTQPGARAERELLRAIFPSGHPYRSSGSGDRRSARRIEVGSLRRFHREFWTSGESTLVATGSPNLRELSRVARTLFRELRTNRRPAMALPKVSGRPRPPIRVSLPGHSQVEIRVGGASLARSEPQFLAAYLANEVLGGVPALSRLFRTIRSEAGLAYHASSHFEAMRWGGYWMAQAGTGKDRWRQVVPMLEKEIRRIDREAVPSRELNAVRESRIGEMALSLETTQDAHELAVDAAYHHLPMDYWQGWPALLRAVTPDQVRSAAREALDLGRSVTVVAGPLT